MYFPQESQGSGLFLRRGLFSLKIGRGSYFRVNIFWGGGLIWLIWGGCPTLVSGPWSRAYLLVRKSSRFKELTDNFTNGFVLLFSSSLTFFCFGLFSCDLQTNSNKAKIQILSKRVPGWVGIFLTTNPSRSISILL